MCLTLVATAPPIVSNEHSSDVSNVLTPSRETTPKEIASASASASAPSQPKMLPMMVFKAGGGGGTTSSIDSGMATNSTTYPKDEKEKPCSSWSPKIPVPLSPVGSTPTTFIPLSSSSSTIHRESPIARDQDATSPLTRTTTAARAISDVFITDLQSPSSTSIFVPPSEHPIASLPFVTSPSTFHQSLRSPGAHSSNSNSTATGSDRTITLSTTRRKPKPLHLDLSPHPSPSSSARPSSMFFKRTTSTPATKVAGTDSSSSRLWSSSPLVMPNAPYEASAGAEAETDGPQSSQLDHHFRARQQEFNNAKRLTTPMLHEEDKDFLQGLPAVHSSSSGGSTTECCKPNGVNAGSLASPRVENPLCVDPDFPLAATGSTSSSHLPSPIWDSDALAMHAQRASCFKQQQALPQLVIRNRHEMIRGEELERLLDEADHPSKKRRILIVDTRPLPVYLAGHLAHSANVVVPSLITKRCRYHGAHIWQGGWDALGGFISTEGGRNAWEQAFQVDALHVELLVLSNQQSGNEAETGHVVEMIARHLAKKESESQSHSKSHSRHPQVRVRWLEGGWQSTLHIREKLKRWLREGEKSVVPNQHLQQPPALMPHPILTPSPEDLISPHPYHSSAGPINLAFSASMLAPPPPMSAPGSALHGPSHQTSLPPLRDTKRHLPRAMRIDTTGANQRSVSLGEQRVGKLPPKLNLDTSARMVPRRVSLAGAGGPHTPSIRTHDLDQPPFATSPSSSTPLLAHAQSHLPPSPSSFAGVTYRVKHHDPQLQLGGGALRTARPWGGQSSHSRDSSSQSAYPPSPEEENMHVSNSTFLVSTILPQFLYLGPEIATEEDVQKLLDLGVKRILNVAIECGPDEKLHLQDRFDKYLQLPLRDCVDETGVLQGVRTACSFLDDARLHSSPTYVHCRAGKSRSVTVVLGYLIHANAWTFKTSYAYVSERRPGISPNLGFVSELYSFEASELGLRARSSGLTDDDEPRAREVVGAGKPATKNSSSSSSSQAIVAENQSPRKNKAYRESLPPMWSSSLDTGLQTQEALSFPTLEGETDQPLATSQPKTITTTLINGRERGIEKEVRKNGQYVHYQRSVC